MNLGRGSDLSIDVRQHYRVVPNPDSENTDPHKPWQVTTVAYYYTLLESEGPEIFSYQWHPEQRSATTFPTFTLKVRAKVGRI